MENVSKTVAKKEGTLGSGPKFWPNRFGRFLRPFNRTANCPMTFEPMQCDKANLRKHMSFFAQAAFTASCQELERQLCLITIDGKPVTAC